VKRLPVIRERHAEEDLAGQIDYLCSERPWAARRYLRAVEAAFRRLAQMPEVGTPRRFRNPRLKGVRMWSVPGFRNHLIFYRVTGDAIEVLRVLHAARDVRKLLEEC
jgi:toxin ParE1/3/4